MGKQKGKAPKNKPKLKLKNKKGFTVNILGSIVRELDLAGADKEYIEGFLEEARNSGSLENLLKVSKKYTDIE